MSLLATAITTIIAFASIMLPGFFLALPLLKKTKLNMFEITTIGFIFGLVFPPVLTWVESYLMNYIHFFSFSAALYAANVVILTAIGFLLCMQQGIFTAGFMDNRSAKDISTQMNADYKGRLSGLRQKLASLNVDISLVREHEKEESDLARRHATEHSKLQSLPQEERARIEKMHEEEARKMSENHEKEERYLLHRTQSPNDTGLENKLVWGLLLFLMLFTFVTRLMSVGIAPHFFEFDPYFDMQSTEFILTHGYQWLYDHSAWPVAYNFTTSQVYAVNGTPHRIEPIVPYLEAYWYQISNPPANQISQTLLSDVSSLYPPITAALLVFVIFMFLYHTYGEYPALIGAILATAMPALITTFISGEQLVEPWGIFAMFFFYAAYLLAVQNMKEKRFAILAGIAFASSFLGAHYYTVIAGVLALYIVCQGTIDVLRKNNTIDFYKMNAIVIAIIAFFYILFNPYNTVLTNKIPGVLGVPIIVSFPLLALLFVAAFEYGPQLFKKYQIIPDARSSMVSVGWLILLLLIGGLLVFFTPLGKSVQGYLALSSHYTTPSIALFMTVQEYAPTGFNFDFGSAGFGIIGASIPLGTTATGGATSIGLIVWLVLILFAVLAIWVIFKRDDKGSILAFWIVAPLALAGMVEIKYLPHFGAAYILAFCAIIGELLILTKSEKLDPEKFRIALVGVPSAFILILIIASVISPSSVNAAALLLSIVGAGAFVALTWNFTDHRVWQVILAFALMIAMLELSSVGSIFAGFGATCNSIAQQGNSLSADMFCNVVPNAWLSATTWMKQYAGPVAPRILSWWDYGDWINWFGNSNAVLRGDNSIAKLDYMTASRFVLGSQNGFGPSNLTSFMNNIAQSKWVLFDDQLTAKWQALDFLACVNVNQTSRAFAIAQANGTGSPYVLGTSQCELNHDPAYIMVPINASLSNHCLVQNKTADLLQTKLLVGSSVSANQSYCVPTSFLATDLSNLVEYGIPAAKAVRVLDQNGNPTNILLIAKNQFFGGFTPYAGQEYVAMIAIYLPNGPNSTITNAPSQFYNSNYYRGFYLGNLPGFKIAYPTNFTGINFVNGTWPVVIYQVNNYTGSLPTVTPKPLWVVNNFSMPG